MERASLLAELSSEQTQLEELLGEFSDAEWEDDTRPDGWTVHEVVAHIADSHYGLALLALGEVKPSLPVDPTTGWMNPDAHNEQRRQRNRTLPREKVMQRLNASFGHARRAIETIEDYSAPGPYGEVHTVGFWLQRIVDHSRAHREELEAIKRGEVEG